MHTHLFFFLGTESAAINLHIQYIYSEITITRLCQCLFLRLCLCHDDGALQPHQSSNTSTCQALSPKPSTLNPELGAVQPHFISNTVI